jgi:hypothetical protein
MKALSEYTPEEKIAKFDRIYLDCHTELIVSRSDADYDEHYFWEGMMEEVLGMDASDWEDYRDAME